MAFIGDYESAIRTYVNVIAEVKNELKTFNTKKSSQLFVKQSVENLYSMLKNE